MGKRSSTGPAASIGQRRLAAFFQKDKKASAATPDVCSAKPVTAVNGEQDTPKLSHTATSSKAEVVSEPVAKGAGTDQSKAEALLPMKRPRTSGIADSSASRSVAATAPDELCDMTEDDNGVQARGAGGQQAERKRDPMRQALAKRKLGMSRRRLALGPDESHAQPLLASAGPKAKLTPLEQQIVHLKKQNPSQVLIVECGYKFRFFGEDAELAAANLNIYAFRDHNFMTASIPIHRLHIYVRRLVRLGHKVAIVRQMETAALKAASDTKSRVFVRKVAAVYTPATLEAGAAEDVGIEAAATCADDTEGGAAPASASAPSCLLCLCEDGAGDGRGDIAFVAMEPTLSCVYWGVCTDRVTSGTLESALMYFKPQEVLVAGALSKDAARLVSAFVETARGATQEALPSIGSPHAAQVQEVRKLCSGPEAALEAFVAQAEALPAAALMCMLGAFRYLKDLGLELWNEAGIALRPMTEPGHMCLSSNALAQLHVLDGGDGTTRGSLLDIMDSTKSRAGARHLRQWLSQPLVDVPAIRTRQDAVAELLNNAELQDRVREAVAGAADLDRAVGRIFLARASPAEFAATMSACADLPGALLGADVADNDGQAPGALAETSGAKADLLLSCFQAACNPEMVQQARTQLALIDTAAAADNNLRQLFQSKAHFPEVFRRHAELAAAEQALQDLLPQFAKRVGMQKLAYTSVQNQGDYLLELPVDFKVPSSWVKVCATKKVNRWRPAEVAAAVAERERCNERLQATCKQAWQGLLQQFSPHCPAFRATAHALATLDCLQAFTSAAQCPGQCRPHFVEDAEAGMISIQQGRAPLLDALLPGGAVPNDVMLGGDGVRSMVISGPNMGGKSSFMCQVAQLVLLAQAGAWVPAAAMRLTVMDALHTRMGAHDNILQGRSTFLEELLDASSLLGAATPRSLVILDELGRGTATHDGVAIAVAALERLVHAGCCCLFVTHYPEVCEAAQALAPYAACFHMAYTCTDAWSLAAPPHAAHAPLTQENQNGDVDMAAAQSPGGGRENCDSSNSATVAAAGGSAQLRAEDAGARAASKATAAKPTGPQKTNKVTFLYKVREGAAGASFGLNVAMLAGLPSTVVARAAAVAKCLEQTSSLQAGSCAAQAPAAAAVHCQARGREHAAIVSRCLQSDAAGLQQLRVAAAEALRADGVR